MFKEFTTAGIIFMSTAWIAVFSLLIFSFSKAMKKNELHDDN